MSSPPDLKTSQTLFRDLMRAPEGVEPGARQLVGEGRLESTDLSFLVRGDARLGPAARLDIYAGMYFYRLRDSLAEDFPKTVAVIGGARFHNLITDFLLVHPSGSWSLRFTGVPLAGFIATHPLSREFPFLADLARLEWARIESFDDENAEPIPRDRIARLGEDGIGRLRLGLVPACRLLEVEYAVAPLWLAIERGNAPRADLGNNTEAAVASEGFEEIPPVRITKPDRAAGFIRVWRHGFRVFHRTMRSDEHACLVRLRDAGGTLPEVGDIILEHLGREEGAGGAEGKDGLQEEATRRMAGLFELWLSEGLLTEL